MQKTLNEVIMTHCTNNENTKLVIINNLDNATGNIWLAKNKVAHATLEEVSTPRTGLAALYKILRSMALRPTDFPEPVVPATSRCGIFPRSTMTG